MTEPMIWLDGSMRPAADARIAPSDRGLLLGDGVFETIRVAGGRALHVSAHLRRLATGARTLAITLPASEATIRAAMDAVIDGNTLNEGSLRLTLTRGPGPRGVLPADPGMPTLMITGASGPADEHAIDVVIATITRRNEFSPLSGIKSLNYLDNILARREAAQRGAGEAILLNTRGLVAEASCANLLWLRDGILLTPPLTDGALGGVIRGCLIGMGALREASLLAGDLAAADAVFVCNSLALRAVERIDGSAVPTRPDLLTELRNMALIEGQP